MAHGGNIRKFQEYTNDNTPILDFSASINPLGFPKWLRAVISRNLSEAIHYPDIEAQDFIEAAATALNLEPAEITPANGTTELIFTLPGLFEFSQAIIPEPSYIDYRTACEKEGLDIISLPLIPENCFTLDYHLLKKALATPSLVFLGHPNNPTGTIIDIDKMETVIAEHPQSVFIIDEAYIGFTELTEELSFKPLIRKYNNLIILRSLTKLYALAGLRLGIALSCSDLACRMRDALPPWSVNTLSQKVGTRAVQDCEFAAKSREIMAALRTEFHAELQKIAGIKVFPTAANFVLCQLTAELTAPELFNLLIKTGIAIRDCSDFKHLDNSFFRLAIKDQAANAKLFSALNSALHPETRRHNNSPKPTPSLMLLGCSSNAGKSIIAAALCRILLQDGIKVAPFKSQNMALNSFVTRDGLEMGRAQAVQAQASRLEADVRMNPILLKPNSDTGSQVIVMGKPVGNMRVKEYINYKDQAFTAAKEAYDSLASDYEAIILEGAGSPGEINLKQHDIVNTRMAAYASAPAILVGDIDRGGIYASFIGMYETFEEWERELVKGFLVNRFRGDASLLTPAHEYVKDFTGREVIGVVPYLKNLGLPEEDSVSFNDNFIPRSPKDKETLDVALIALPHVSNFTDFDALSNEPEINLRLVKTSSDLGQPDCILLPGSKNVIGDLKFLEESGLSNLIIASTDNSVIAGICGGFQILGQTVSDPHNIEGGGSIAGLGLLAVSTILARDKTLIRTEARHLPSGETVHGYEIHHGKTEVNAEDIIFSNSSPGILGAGTNRIWGSYLHGIFDNDSFRRYFINTIHQVRGSQPTTEIRYHYDLEPAFDRLADTVRSAIDMEQIYRIMEL